jgi:hypothetical protein
MKEDHKVPISILNNNILDFTTKNMLNVITVLFFHANLTQETTLFN